MTIDRGTVIIAGEDFTMTDPVARCILERLARHPTLPLREDRNLPSIRVLINMILRERNALAAAAGGDGSGKFRAALAHAGMATPLRIDESDPAQIIAADGAHVLQLDPDATIDDAEELARRALKFVATVNAAAGFKAVSDPPGLTPLPQSSKEPAS